VRAPERVCRTAGSFAMCVGVVGGRFIDGPCWELFFNQDREGEGRTEVARAPRFLAVSSCRFFQKSKPFHGFKWTRRVNSTRSRRSRSCHALRTACADRRETHTTTTTARHRPNITTTSHSPKSQPPTTTR
jgi:hypothetical protein